MAKQEVAIKVEGVSKSFKLPHEKANSIKSALINLRKKKRGYEMQHVLKDISFEIKKGEFFGIVGRNGSGKSTLLKLLAGIYTPEKGKIIVNGSLIPFIELGVGFNPELTGRENVYLNGSLLGFNRTQMDEMYDKIVEFAELERFMDQKLRNYSSGMQVRLAFSIAIRAKSDILLLDEVLAVGDSAFQAKCFDYFYELKQRKATVIFVSHDKASLERFCTHGILVDNGEIIENGKIEKVLDKYTSVVLRQMDRSKQNESGDSAEEQELAHGAKLRSVQISQNSKRVKNAEFGEVITVKCDVLFDEPVDNPILGITLWKQGVEKNAIFAANNITENIGEIGHVTKGQSMEYVIDLPQYINDGDYSIEVGIANDSVSRFLLQERQALTFRIFGSNNPHALMATQANMKIDR